MLSNTDLKVGVIFKDGSKLYKVIKYDHVMSGRGGAVGKVRVKDLETGSITVQSYKQNDKVEDVDAERKSMQFLYSDDRFIFLMDSDTFEQVSIPLSVVGDSIKYLANGEKIIVFLIDDKPISLEIPKSIEQKVEYTEPAVKGNTSSGAMKTAKLENGLKVQVPLFINTGDIVKINTDSGAYVSRSKIV